MSAAAIHTTPRLLPCISYWSLPPTCIAGGALCSDASHLYRHPLPICIITGAQEDAPRSFTASPAPTAETHSPHNCGVRACARQRGDGGRVGRRGRGSHGSMLGWGWGLEMCGGGDGGGRGGGGQGGKGRWMGIQEGWARWMVAAAGGGSGRRIQ